MLFRSLVATGTVVVKVTGPRTVSRVTGSNTSRPGPQTRVRGSIAGRGDRKPTGLRGCGDDRRAPAAGDCTWSAEVEWRGGADGMARRCRIFATNGWHWPHTKSDAASHPPHRGHSVKVQVAQAIAGSSAPLVGWPHLRHDASNSPAVGGDQNHNKRFDRYRKTPCERRERQLRRWNCPSDHARPGDGHGKWRVLSGDDAHQRYASPRV